MVTGKTDPHLHSTGNHWRETNGNGKPTTSHPHMSGTEDVSPNLDGSDPVNADVMCNLPLYDPPKWGWCALGGVVDLLTPQERARRRQTRETFLRRQRLIQRKAVAAMTINPSHVSDQEGITHDTGPINKQVPVKEEATEGAPSTTAISSNNKDEALENGIAPRQTRVETGVEEKNSKPLNERAPPQSAKMPLESVTPQGRKGEGAGENQKIGVENSVNAKASLSTEKDKRKDTPTPHKQRIWKAPDDHSDFDFNAKEFSVDAYGPNLISGQEPRNPSTGYLLPNKLFSTALDTNHTWDPNTVAKVLIRFPLTDDDEDENNGNDASREYFEEILDWDLGDPETLSPASFALKTATEFGLAKHDMWDLQTSIELQLDQFARSKLNYKPPIPVHEPFGLQRSDDENYNVSQVQRSTDRASSKRRSGGGGRRSNGVISRGGGGGGRGFPRKPPARSVVHFDHSEFFIDEVKKKLQIESKGQCQACEETNGGNFKYEHNAICHICHIRKPTVIKFGCGIKAHGLCDNHCQSRLNFTAADAKKGLSTEALKYDKGGCCPICSMMCYCPKCLRRLDGICHEVGAVCMENKVLHPDWATDVPDSAKGDENASPVHDMDRFVIKTLENKSILGFSMGKLQVPKVVPSSRSTKTNESGDDLGRGGAAGGDSTVTSEAGTEASTGAGTRKRSRYSAFGDDEIPISTVRSSRSGRPRVSELPYEMMDGQITHIPAGMSQNDIEIIGTSGGGRGRAVASPSKSAESVHEEEKEDTHADYCVICTKGPGRGIKLLCCDVCPRAFHPKCIRNKNLGNQGLLALQNLRAGQKEGSMPWECPLCCRDDQVLETDKVDGLQCMAALEPVMSTLAYEPHFYHGFRLLCKVNEIVLRLMEFDFGNWFCAPVDVAIVPDYLDKLTHPPMDLGTVAKKLVNGDYIAALSAGVSTAVGLNEDHAFKESNSSKDGQEQRKEELDDSDEQISKMKDIEEKAPKVNEVLLSVLKDIELIWHNCFTYNNAGSAVYRMGEVQRKKFLTLLAGSVTKDLSPSVVNRLDRYVKGLEQFRVNHEEKELLETEEEKEMIRKSKERKQANEVKSEEDKTAEQRTLSSEEGKSDAANDKGKMELLNSNDNLTNSQASKEEKEGKKDGAELEVEKAEETETTEGEERETLEQAKLLKIKEKASQKRLKVHVVCMPRSWGGKQKAVFLVDPVTLEKVQHYSNMKSAFAAFKYLEKLGHKHDIGRDTRLHAKKMTPLDGNINSLDHLREAVRHKGVTQTLFGYFWCFEEDHKQVVTKRNSEQRQQNLMQLAMSNDTAVSTTTASALGPAPGTPVRSPTVNKNGAGTPSGNPAEVFDITAMEKSGFQIEQDLDIGGAEFNFLDDNLLLNTPNSPLRSSATATKGNSPMIRGGESGGLQLGRPNLELPLPTQTREKKSTGPPLPVGLSALEGIGLKSEETNPSPVRAPLSPQIQESKLGDGCKNSAAHNQNVPKSPEVYKKGPFSIAGASSRVTVPVKMTQQASTSSGSFVTFVDDKEKKQM